VLEGLRSSWRKWEANRRRYRLDGAAYKAGGAFTLAVLALFGAACGGHSAAKTRTVPGDPGLEYEARGNFLYLLCAGHGSPTVILEAGLGEDHRDWEPVQSEIALRTRVCSYDRLGIGFSQQAPKRATADQKADDLHALLAAANVDGPYVLVGHSYGGMLVRVYAAAYPHDVAGLVLLDSAHPDQDRRFLAALPPRRAGEAQELRDLRRAIHSSPNAPNPEGVNWKLSTDETRAAGTLGERPLIVVTAGEHDWTATPLPKIDRRLMLRGQLLGFGRCASGFCRVRLRPQSVPDRTDFSSNRTASRAYRPRPVRQGSIWPE